MRINVLFERGRKLIQEIQRAEGVQGTERLADADAQSWLEVLAELIQSTQVVSEWTRFQAAYTPLDERYRQVYETAHAQRDAAVASAHSELETAVVSPNRLRPYECAGLTGRCTAVRCRLAARVRAGACGYRSKRGTGTAEPHGNTAGTTPGGE